jgi:hypothetical protein
MAFITSKYFLAAPLPVGRKRTQNNISFAKYYANDDLVLA